MVGDLKLIYVISHFLIKRFACVTIASMYIFYMFTKLEIINSKIYQCTKNYLNVINKSVNLYF